MPRLRIPCLRLINPRSRPRGFRRARLQMFILLILLVTIILPLTLAYLVYRPPHILIRYLAYRYPDVLWHVPIFAHSSTSTSASRKLIALTIDDAPSEYTRPILSLLSAHNATATFFIIGQQALSQREVLVDIVNQGSHLGNHGMRDEPAVRLEANVLASQIEWVDGVIKGAYRSAGQPFPFQVSSSVVGSEQEDGNGNGNGKGDGGKQGEKFFRPGSGFFSPTVLSVAKSLGYKVALGSIYPHDPQIPYACINARHVLSMARPGGVIICHDRRGWTVPMLDRVLPELKRRGYEVVSLQELVVHASSLQGDRSGGRGGAVGSKDGG